MLLPSVEHVRFTSPDDLRNTGQATERRRIQNPVAIALERVPLILCCNIMPSRLSRRLGPTRQRSSCLVDGMNGIQAKTLAEPDFTLVDGMANAIDSLILVVASTF